MKFFSSFETGSLKPQDCPKGNACCRSQGSPEGFWQDELVQEPPTLTRQQMSNLNEVMVTCIDPADISYTKILHLNLTSSSELIIGVVAELIVKTSEYDEIIVVIMSDIMVGERSNYMTLTLTTPWLRGITTQ